MTTNEEPSVPTSTAAETIARVCEPIQRYTRTWMLAKSTDAYGVALGFGSGAQFWVVGRAGVLGSCPVEVAAAAIAFEPLYKVSEAWHGVPPGLTHYDVALRYRRIVTEWGERLLADTDPDRLEHIDALGRRIVDAAPGALGAIFTGWRSLDIPASLPARAGLTLHLIRELRGAAHIAAILACGLTPLDAVLAATQAPPRTGPLTRRAWVGRVRSVTRSRYELSAWRPKSSRIGYSSPTSTTSRPRNSRRSARRWSPCAPP